MTAQRLSASKIPSGAPQEFQTAASRGETSHNASAISLLQCVAHASTHSCFQEVPHCGFHLASCTCSCHSCTGAPSSYSGLQSESLHHTSALHGVGRYFFRSSPCPCTPRSHMAGNNGLSLVTDVDMLDSDVLSATDPNPMQSQDSFHKHPHQPGRGIHKCRCLLVGGRLRQSQATPLL